MAWRNKISASISHPPIAMKFSLCWGLPIWTLVNYFLMLVHPHTCIYFASEPTSFVFWVSCKSECEDNKEEHMSSNLLGFSGSVRFPEKELSFLVFAVKPNKKKETVWVNSRIFFSKFWEIFIYIYFLFRYYLYITL